MAKRKRLTPAQPAYLDEATPRAPEIKALSGPPIAQVAGETAASAALRELSEEIQAARREGRLVQLLPLDTVEADHLVRDRIALDGGEFEALMRSLAARGQQTPIEVEALENGRYGLISGWRRLEALRRLHAENGEARFATVRAFLRAPETASEAYLAMIEENEIRVGLSYYERARIVARAVERGVFGSQTEALRHLFASASRAKRSKIGAFVPIYRALDGALRFPSALPERLGLRLSRALSEDPGLAPHLTRHLDAAAPVDAAGEQAALARALRPAAPARPAPAPCAIGVRQVPDGLLLSGPGIDAAFRRRLEAWLAQQG